MKAIFTNDDAGSVHSPEAVADFDQVVEWLDSRKIPATFFWVPKGKGHPTPEDKNWIRAIHQAHEKGHDFQLHGLTHDGCLEFGVPQASTRKANPKVFEEYERNLEKWRHEHSRERLRQKLAEGIDIHRQVFGHDPTVFRAPCYGVCPELYQALDDVGIRYSSSRGINPTATAYTILKDTSMRRWMPDFPGRPFREPPGILEIPCVEDLMFAGVTREEYDDRMDLFRTELQHVMEEIGPEGVLVLGTHFRPMVRTWDLTHRFYEELFEWLASEGVDEWITCGKAAEMELFGD